MPAVASTMDERSSVMKSVATTASSVYLQPRASMLPIALLRQLHGELQCAAISASFGIYLETLLRANDNREMFCIRAARPSLISSLHSRH